MSEHEAQAFYEALKDELARRDIEQDREQLTRSLRKFTYAAWPHLGYPPIPVTWHVDAICEHVQAAYEREIPRLVVTIQPGSFKSTILSVLAPAWRWTHQPAEQFVTASHADSLAIRDTGKSRSFMFGSWFQARWGESFQFSESENIKTRYSNTMGGHRVITHVEGGTGDRGSILQLDDPHNAKEARYADTQLPTAIEWWSDTWVSRLNDTIGHPGVMIVIGQRIHERDLIGFLLDTSGERWTHLCLPTKYDPKHPFIYPEKVFLRNGKQLSGDPRHTEGELLMPLLQDEQKLADKIIGDGVTTHIFAGQYQQLPAAREGDLLKTAWWRWYDPRVRGKEEWDTLGRFGMIVISADTPLKDKESSDNVAVQCWGVKGADRYLLDLRLARMNYGLAKRTIKEMALWARRHWPYCPHFVLIENAGYGVELIIDLKREITGVQKISPAVDGNKEQRAAAASDGLESGNYFLPGYGPPWQPAYDEHRTPADVADFVANCARFPHAAHDDDVDAWSQLGNWLRSKSAAPIRTSKLRRRLPAPLR